MSRLLFAIAATLPLLASPASAATWLFGTAGAAASVASKSSTVIGDATLTAVARRYTPAPTTALTNISQLLSTASGGSPLLIRTTVPGIGVAGGGDTVQVDTNSANLREAVLITTNAAKLRLTGVKLSLIDANDTLRIYGLDEFGGLTSLGFTNGLNDRIALGLGGAATVVNDGSTSTLTFTDPYITPYLGFVFTTAVGGDVNFGGDTGQGYRIDFISGVTVPEPATWALLVAGFGLVGVSLRRRTTVSRNVAA